MVRLYLSSRSPRRAELLDQIGASFVPLAPPDIVEQPAVDECPADYVCRMAYEKARAGFQCLQRRDGVVLGADTAVVLDGCIFGKPVDDRHALAMLERLNGRQHRVLSAVCLYCDEQYRVARSDTEVTFRVMAPARLQAYVATGEGRDKAGAYAIQGRGAALVASLQGSYSGVVGLPLEQTVLLLDWAGIPYWQ